jgi:DNA-directed RNA polymerase subunit L
MESCFDVILENEDYTIGKVVEYILYEKYYQGDKSLSYCGFKKFHPHHTDSIIRVAFAKDLGNEGRRVCKDMLIDACNQAQGVYSKIFGMF